MLNLTGTTTTFASTIDGGGALNLNGGSFSFGGNVGSGSSLASFSLGGSSSISQWPDSIITTGALSFTPDISIPQDVSPF